jgi:hypothetical protein
MHTNCETLDQDNLPPTVPDLPRQASDPTDARKLGLG